MCANFSPKILRFDTYPSEAPRNLGSDFGKGLRPGIHEIGSEAALIDLPDLKL